VAVNEQPGFGLELFDVADALNGEHGPILEALVLLYLSSQLFDIHVNQEVLS
jgi:hypothetical protein